MNKLKTLIKISRPRFWLYAGGTFWVGAIAGASELSQLASPLVLLLLIYFMIPANIFIYGINDMFDGDTDEFNSKKDDKEHRLQNTERSWLQSLVYGSLVLGIVLAILTPNIKATILFLIFLFLAWAYSSLPFRFKAKPFIDAISNVHYAVIGFVAYALLSGEFPPLWAIIAAWSWTASMHIFSAVPDIASDKQANLTTTAVLLKEKWSLVLCTVLWVITAILFTQNFPGTILTYLAYVYPLSSLLLLIKPSVIHRVYWWFPYINGIIGLLLFWYIFLSKFNFQDIIQ